MKEVPFLSKNGIQKGTGLDLEAEPPRIELRRIGGIFPILVTFIPNRTFTVRSNSISGELLRAMVCCRRDAVEPKYPRPLPGL